MKQKKTTQMKDSSTRN